MFVSRYIYTSLEKLAINFNNNHSILIDFLFYVFDRFSLEEKKTILKSCALIKDKKVPEEGKATDSKVDRNIFSEEIKIDIHPLLEQRLVNLILECDKLQCISDALEFLIFISTLIEKDLFRDLIIQYSIENIQATDFTYMNATKPENYEVPNPFHTIPNIPDRSQILFYN